MIALRHQIERGVRHPVLGPFFLFLLALLLVFSVIHGAHDQIHSGELMVCVALLVGVLVLLTLPRLPDVVSVSRRPPRGPPHRLFAAHLPRHTVASAAPIPLRL